MFRLQFSLKFYLGIVFIIFSLIVGNLSKILFFLYFNDVTLRLLWAVIYLLSWPLLLWGTWWAGSETYGTLRKYFSYRFYQQKLKEKGQKVYSRTRQLKEKMKEKIKGGPGQNSGQEDLYS